MIDLLDNGTLSTVARFLSRYLDLKDIEKASSTKLGVDNQYEVVGVLRLNIIVTNREHMSEIHRWYRLYALDKHRINISKIEGDKEIILMNVSPVLVKTNTSNSIDMACIRVEIEGIMEIPYVPDIMPVIPFKLSDDNGF